MPRPDHMATLEEKAESVIIIRASINDHDLKFVVYEILYEPERGLTYEVVLRCPSTQEGSVCQCQAAPCHHKMAVFKSMCFDIRASSGPQDDMIVQEHLQTYEFAEIKHRAETKLREKSLKSYIPVKEVRDTRLYRLSKVSGYRKICSHARCQQKLERGQLYVSCLTPKIDFLKKSCAEDHISYCAMAGCLRGDVVPPYVKIPFNNIISAGGKLRASRKRVSCGGGGHEITDQDHKIIEDMEKNGIKILD